MRRTLSSELTFFWKVVFPTLWIGGALFGTLVLVAGNMATDAGKRPIPPEFLFALPIFFLVMVAFTWWTCIRLKAVAMDDEALYVSNYLKEVRIPLSEVKKVEQDTMLNTRPITVTFVRPTVFGKRIVFMGRMGLFDWKDIDPVELIREAAASAQLAVSTQPTVSGEGGSSDAITTAPGAGAHVVPRTEITNLGPGDIRKEGGKRG